METWCDKNIAITKIIIITMLRSNPLVIMEGNSIVTCDQRDET